MSYIVAWILPAVPPVFLSTSPRVDIVQNSTDSVILSCSLRGYPLSALRWMKDGTPLDPDGSHITITTFRRQDPTDPYPFSSTTDSSFEPIPLEGLEYFEAVSELTLAPPLLLTDTADYTCEVEADFVQSITAISDNIPVIIIGEPLLTLFIQLLYLTVHCSLSHWNLPSSSLSSLLILTELPREFIANIKLILGPVSDCPTWVVSLMLYIQYR